MNLSLRKSSFIEAISGPDGSESMFLYPSLQCFSCTAPQLYIPGFGVLSLAIISLSSQVQNLHHNLMHIENRQGIVLEIVKVYKLKCIFILRKYFQLIYCTVCAKAIWLNESHVSTMENIGSLRSVLVKFRCTTLPLFLVRHYDKHGTNI